MHNTCKFEALSMVLPADDLYEVLLHHFGQSQPSCSSQPKCQQVLQTFCGQTQQDLTWEEMVQDISSRRKTAKAKTQFWLCTCAEQARPHNAGNDPEAGPAHEMLLFLGPGKVMEVFVLGASSVLDILVRQARRTPTQVALIYEARYRC